MKTLAQFQASRVHTDDIGALLRQRQPAYDWGFVDEDGPLPGYVYDGDAYIYEMEDGRVVLTVYNHEIARPSVEHLPELEIRLWEWWCVEGGDNEYDKDEAVVICAAVTFVDDLLSTIGRDNFEKVCRLNETPAYANACASHDYCDANIIMSEACTKAREYLDDSKSRDDIELMSAAWEFAHAHLLKPLVYTDVLKPIAELALEALQRATGKPVDDDDRGMFDQMRTDCDITSADLAAWVDDLEARVGLDVGDFRTAVLAYRFALDRDEACTFFVKTADGVTSYQFRPRHLPGVRHWQYDAKLAAFRQSAIDADMAVFDIHMVTRTIRN